MKCSIFSSEYTKRPRIIQAENIFNVGRIHLLMTESMKELIVLPKKFLSMHDFVYNYTADLLAAGIQV